jgi:transposase
MKVDTPVRDEAGAVPFASVFVMLTKQEHIELIRQARSWQSLHQRAVQRAQGAALLHQQQLRELRVQAAQREAELLAELELAQASVRDLKQRVFGRKSEQRKGGSQSRVGASGTPATRSRGHQTGAPGHGRSRQTALPERIEIVDLNEPHCPQCGLHLGEFPGTEDSEIVEIDVQAYRRVVRRKRYRPLCECGCLSGIVTAPAAPRLIPRGKYGVSVWASVLLDKFLYGRPSHRLLQDWATQGLQMSPGTLAGGLQSIAPLFEPLEQALLAKLRSEQHWHADETRWAVFEATEGKVGSRHYLWVFHSPSVVH